MRKKLSKDFYTRPAAAVAKELLGKYLVVNGVAGKIIETEAYTGSKDRASHAFGGKITERNRIMYSEGGRVYIYFIYGMYWQLNVTAGGAGDSECVLIRGIDAKGEDVKKTNGPGKLSRFLNLDKSFYGEDLTQSPRIWIENSNDAGKMPIMAGPRVGVGYAGPYWSKRKLRFYFKNYANRLPKT